MPWWRGTCRRAPFALIPLACACSGQVPAADPSEIPFVGCPSGGQQGALTAPESGSVPAVAPREAAQRIAYYSDGSTAVLAPRGWHCASVWGSSGGALLVTPRRADAEAFLHLRDIAPDFGVQLTYNYGGTSGRFAVAEVIARIFPDHMAFARRVAAEEIPHRLPSGPYEDDQVRRVSDSEVEYTTPAGRNGLGTAHSTLATRNAPIHGVIILYPDEDMTMLQLAYRLPPADAPMASAIVQDVRRSRGSTAE